MVFRSSLLVTAAAAARSGRPRLGHPSVAMVTARDAAEKPLGGRRESWEQKREEGVAGWRGMLLPRRVTTKASATNQSLVMHNTSLVCLYF